MGGGQGDKLIIGKPPGGEPRCFYFLIKLRCYQIFLFSEDERNVLPSCISPVRRSPLLLPCFGGRSADTSRGTHSETSLKKLFQNFFFKVTF